MVLAEVLWQLACGSSASSMRTSHLRLRYFVRWEAYRPHNLSLPSTLPLAKQMGTLNVRVRWRPSGPNTSVMRPPSECAARTPHSRTERTWWKAVVFCPLESFASNLGMIPRGHHDHDLFLNFRVMIESVKKRHSIPCRSFLVTWVWSRKKRPQRTTNMPSWML
jgi:hypothetical protein